MIVNNVDIQVVTDYTAFTNTVRFQVAVPVSADAAKTIYEDLTKGDWSQTESDIKAAVQKSAPSQIQTLVTTLLQAYSGTPSGDNGGDPNPPDPNPEPDPDKQ